MMRQFMVLTVLALITQQGCSNSGGGQFGALSAADNARSAASAVKASCGDIQEAVWADHCANTAEAAAEAMHQACIALNDATKKELATHLEEATARTERAAKSKTMDTTKDAFDRFEQTDKPYRKAMDKLTNARVFLTAAQDAGASLLVTGPLQLKVMNEQANFDAEKARAPKYDAAVTDWQAASKHYTQASNEETAAKAGLDAAQAAYNKAQADVKAQTQMAQDAAKAALDACPEARRRQREAMASSHSAGQDVSGISHGGGGATGTHPLNADLDDPY